jgi:hypothetical protein
MDVQTVVANVLTFNTNTFVRPALQGLADPEAPQRGLQSYRLVILAPAPR